MRGIKTKEQGKWKRMLIFCSLFIVLLLLLNSVHNVYKKKKAADEALVQMQKETNELEQRENVLEKSIDRMKTTEGIEFEMRKNLNVVREGEKVAIIVDEKNSSSTTQSEETVWQKTKNFFKNLFK